MTARKPSLQLIVDSALHGELSEELLRALPGLGPEAVVIAMLATSKRIGDWKARHRIVRVPWLPRSGTMSCGRACHDPHVTATRTIGHPVDSGLRRTRIRPMLGREANLSALLAIERLVVYGSLAPGRSNHHYLAGILGTWREGWVEGVLHDRGWGAAQGFPGIHLARGGPRVEVQVLESYELAQHWDRLDAFEGDEYSRVPVEIHGLETGTVAGWIYALTTACPDHDS